MILRSLKVGRFAGLNPGAFVEFGRDLTVVHGPNGAGKSTLFRALTYALYQRAHQPSGSLYDTCDSTSCQVYKGLAGYTSTGGGLTPYENSSSTAAVAATSARVRAPIIFMVM